MKMKKTMKMMKMIMKLMIMMSQKHSLVPGQSSLHATGVESQEAQANCPVQAMQEEMACSAAAVVVVASSSCSSPETAQKSKWAAPPLE